MRAVPMSIDGSQFHRVSQKSSPMFAIALAFRVSVSFVRYYSSDDEMEQDSFVGTRSGAVWCGGLVLVLRARPIPLPTQDKHQAPTHPHRHPLSLRSGMGYVQVFVRHVCFLAR